MATDSHGRRIDYLRVSLTDRCNLRCRYCMPEAGVVWKPHSEILTYEEIVRFARIAVEQGISKIRLTGGEPLVRGGVVDFVEQLMALPGIESVAMTTNGTLLPRFADQLFAAGLRRVNISLDSLDPSVFAEITRGGRLDEVLEGIDAAFRAGFDPVKLNVVVVRSLNQDLCEFARLTFDKPLHVRFIEYMPVGDAEEGSGCSTETTDGWTRADSVPSEEVLDMLAREGRAAGLGELEPIARDGAPGGWGPAQYFRFPGAQGTVGVISPLSHHFCAECNRLRLTADGRLRPCLFSDHELDVRTALRTGDDEAVRELVLAALRDKPESHDMRVGTARGMSQIGG
ncbi:MAG: GTP 3',8-cyclase MoaA [Coriobacteriia bacterium]|nr:GTP 3',8-cyclase MoaA [Coriobacteriia bacterium]